MTKARVKITKSQKLEGVNDPLFAGAVGRSGDGKRRYPRMWLRLPAKLYLPFLVAAPEEFDMHQTPEEGEKKPKTNPETSD